MSKLPSASAAAAIVGIVGSNWVAGGIAGLSHFTMPGLLSANVPGHLLAQQWASIFRMGKAAMPAVAVISLGAYAYRAYDRSRRHLDWTCWAAAGVLTLSIVPFTLVAMNPTNQSLLQIAGGGATAAVVNDESVRALITKWAGLNLIRSLLPLGGAVFGLWTLVTEKEGPAGVENKESKDAAKSHPAASSTTALGDDVSKTHPASY
ncbi:hypothetical protein GE09DRAFT_186762 [Coniochaeta sp. 2T2.1]|nr:hypothetical protein GE09DRAFT_186762 [Coniochaeta sp. 2T2.1]